MEEWQRKWIVTNGPRLYRLTEVTPGVLNKLCSKRILAQDDVDELIRIGKHEKDGVAVQKSEFFSKLMKRDCYNDVIQVFRDCRLYGAADLLIEGKEANENKLKHVDQRQSAETSESEAEINLFGKIATELRYYIPRSIRSRFVLSKEIIFHKDTKDILLFTGIKQHELSSYLGQRSSDKSGSQLTQTTLSVNHILLETKGHFQRICELAKEKSVHWLHHENGRFLWVKSGNGGMSTIQKATKKMKKENEVFTETDFLAHLDKHEKKFGNSPVVIADTPGMGKSELLQSFARQIVKRKQRAVVLVVISELINLIKKKMKSSQLSNKYFEEALIQLTTESCRLENRRDRLKTLFQSPSREDEVTIELMLDGFDEMSSKDLPLAHQLYSLVRRSYPSTRIWVATRPHLLHELENELNVTGFTILPFQESDQEQFLVSFWHSKICKNVTSECLHAASKCSDVDPNLVLKFAKHCLKTLAKTCPKSSKGKRPLCGVPLQCLMLAEVFQQDCLNFVNRDNWTSEEEPTLSLKITSIKDLYEALINVKLDKFADRYYSKELRPKKRVQLLNQHVYLALLLLFQKYADDFVDTLKIGRRDSSSPPDLNEKDILNVGIVEDICGAPDNQARLRFIHRTLAEFLVARFIVQQLCPAEEYKASSWRTFGSELLKCVRTIWSINPVSKVANSQHLQVLLRDEVFQTENQDLEMEPSLDDDETFVHDVIVFFIDSLLEGRNLEECTKLRDLIPSSSKGYIVAACVQNDLFNIFRILVTDNETHGHRVVDILEVGVIHVSLNFLKVLFAKFGELWEEEAKGSEILIQQKAGLLECAVRDREYSIVDYLLNSQGFSKLIEDFVPSIRGLLHDLIFNSNGDSDWLISEKLESLTRLVQLQPKLLEWKSGEKNGPPILQCSVHVELILKLIELGANPLARDDDNSTLLHLCHNLNGEEYHRVVKRLSDEKERQVLEQLVNVKTKNDEKSVLHQIARFIKTPEKHTLECLLSHGADFTAIDLKENNCLHEAAKYGNMGSARVLLEFEIVRKLVNEKNEDGKTPLDVLMTCKRKKLNVEEFGKMLMSHGARLSRDSILHEVLSKEEIRLNRALFLLDVYKIDVNGFDDDGNTLLHACFYARGYDLEERIDFARALLEKGADVKSLNRAHLTPLHNLIREAHETDGSYLEALSMLEEYGALEDSPKMAQIALHFTVQGRSWSLYEQFKQLAEKLIKHGAQVEKISLEDCALNGYTLGIRYILEKRANINLNRGNIQGETILHLYMSSKKPITQVVELLLAEGAEVGALDETGETPLEKGMKASKKLSIEMLELFVSHGAAKLKHPEVANKILFELVERWADEDETEVNRLAEKAISEGGDVHATDEVGSSLLHRAATKRCLPMFKFLVEKGVSVNVRNAREMTPLHCVLRRGGFDTLVHVRLLKELGADLEAVDNENRTMLHFAVKYQSVSVFKYFAETKLYDHLLKDDEFLLDVTSSGKLSNLKELFSNFSGTSLQDVGRNSTNPERGSILHVAVKEGDSDLLKYLLESKLFELSPLSEEELHRFGNVLQVCVSDSDNHRSKSTFVKEKSKIVKILVDSNKELLNTKDASGRTCLHADNVSPPLLHTLIELGADVNCQDGSGKTVVHLAKEYMTEEDYTEFVDFLRSQGHGDSVATIVGINQDVSD